jgi:serine/threonine protein kinase
MLIHAYCTCVGEVKLADFGLARVIEAADYASYDSRVYKTRRPDRDGERDSVFVSSAVTDVLMTPIVTTLWYRAVEVLLGHTFRPRGTGAVAYGPAIDVWSCGCVFGELLGGRPLCPGDDELSQTKCIFALLGPPTESQWPGLVNCRLVVDGTVDLDTTTSSAGGSCIPDLFPRLSSLGTSLLSGCLRYCPERRLTAQEALEHDYFRCSPFPVGAEFMPTFPVQILNPGTSSSSAGATSSGGGRARTAAGGGHSTAVAGRGGLGLGYGTVNPLKRKHEPGTSGRSSGEAGCKQAHRR